MKLRTWIPSRNNYVLYEAEQKVNNLKLSSAVVVWASKYGAHIDGEVLRLHKDKNDFALRSGETTYVFTSLRRRTKLEKQNTVTKIFPSGKQKMHS